MKKLLAILLSLLFVLSACSISGKDESSSADSTAESSATSSELSYQKDTVVSKGAFYQSVSAPSANFPDKYGAELTDGLDLSQVTTYDNEALVAEITKRVLAALGR